MGPLSTTAVIYTVANVSISKVILGAVVTPSTHTLAPTRRGDLETLGYCMLEWANGRLPWDNEDCLEEVVAQLKMKWVWLSMELLVWLTPPLVTGTMLMV